MQGIPTNSDKARSNNQAVSVGIIANPASGSDIRRLVAMGSVYGTQEKINIIQRVIVGVAALGIQKVYLMPDANHMGEVALERLPLSLSEFCRGVQVLDMRPENSSEDSISAAHQMRVAGVNCIVVLGGDGTSRVVAKGCGDVPILPISTGTNNVISYSVEGTVAGLAAGFAARFPGKLSDIAFRSKRLEVDVDGGKTDMALADVAVVEGQAAGSRAIWDPEGLQQAILTRAEPTTTGITSLGAFIEPISPYEPAGVHIKFGKLGMSQVTAPLAPGLMTTIGIEFVRKLVIGDVVLVQGGHTILALDGEREIVLRQGQSAQVRLCEDGPWIVDVFRALQALAKQKTLISSRTSDRLTNTLPQTGQPQG